LSEAFGARFLFGSIRRKLYFAFTIILLIMAGMITLTYDLNRQISQDTIQIREVEAPLQIMTEQVRTYDALLTGDARAALLYAIEDNMTAVALQQQKYNAEGTKLDALLKNDALLLLNRSERTGEQKTKVMHILTQLDGANIHLVELETQAFDAMKNGTPQEAYATLMGEDYRKYKNELNALYLQWVEEERTVTNQTRQKILDNTQKVFYIDFVLGMLAILIGFGIAFFVSDSITKPLGKLYEAAKEIERGNYEVRTGIKTGDELEKLGAMFDASVTALARLDEERRQIDRAKTQFISITSHELRSPMTPMKAQLQMLAKGYLGDLNRKQREAIAITIRNADRLDKIIVDFLEISRIEAARLKFEFKKIRPEQTVQEVLNYMKGYMPEKQIGLVTALEELPEIEADSDRLSQILRNLIGNAIKFSPKGKRVTVGARKEGGMILFWIKDEGIGINKEDQRRLFEPFFQVDKTFSREQGGTGLGLAICRGIVRSQGGSIWVESEPGVGSTFYFTVPPVPVRDVKPIRVLFSSNEEAEKAIRRAFIDMLGPLGETEYEELKKSQRINEAGINSYLDEIEKAGIVEDLDRYRNRLIELLRLRER
jgi:signal transduction histidine kinase